MYTDLQYYSITLLSPPPQNKVKMNQKKNNEDEGI